MIPRSPARSQMVFHVGLPSGSIRPCKQASACIKAQQSVAPRCFSTALRLFYALMERAQYPQVGEVSILKAQRPVKALHMSGKVEPVAHHRPICTMGTSTCCQTRLTDWICDRGISKAVSESIALSTYRPVEVATSN